MVCAPLLSGALLVMSLSIRRRRPFTARIALLLSVAGPGIIAAIADHDAAGILAAVRLFLDPAASFAILPLVAILEWYLVARGTYRRLERILLAASLVYLLYAVSAVLAHPDWGRVLKETVLPDLQRVSPLR